MTATPILRCTTRPDLLAMPAVTLGFHPEDSCVLVGLLEKKVEFVARLQLEWFATHFEQTTVQITNVSERVPGCRFIVLGYGDPDLASLSVAALVDFVGAANVLEALFTDGEQYWALDEPDEAHPFDFRDSAIAAHAVYEGVQVCTTRAEAVAPVVEHRVLDPEEIGDAIASVASLAEEQRWRLLGTLVESTRPLEEWDALTLAVLLGHEEFVIETFAQLSTESAPRFWPALVAARQVSPGFAEANLLALLCAASWLAGYGAAQAACLEQLDQLDPEHPIGLFLKAAHQAGMPPKEWRAG